MMTKARVGVIYLIHLDRPLKHARHYLGWCEKGGLDARLERHRSGNGSKLLRAVNEAGISYQVVRTWTGTRDEERKLKKRKGTPHLCPVCHP